MAGHPQFIATVYAQTDDKLLLEAVKRLDEIDDGEARN
jgi:hypothetical protein